MEGRRTETDPPIFNNPTTPGAPEDGPNSEAHPQQVFQIEQESQQVHWWWIILSQTLTRVQTKILNEEQGQVEEMPMTGEEEGKEARNSLK